MNKAHLYRLKQIHEIEKEIHEEKIKQESIVKKYYCVIKFCDGCFLVVQFCMLLLNVGFLSNFQEIIVKISSMILQGFNLLFGAFSIFLKGIEKNLFKKIQEHEKKKTLVEKEANTIRNLVNLNLKKSFMK